MHDHRLTLAQVCVAAQQQPGGRALHDEGQRGQFVDSLGDVVGPRRGRHRPLRVTTAVDQGHDPPAVPGPSGDLTTGHQRQRARREVGVLRLVGVGVVHPGVGDVDEELSLARFRVRQFDLPQHLGSAELGDLHSTHEMTTPFPLE
jgi:hypothetical protein